MRLLSDFEELAGDDLNLQRRLREAFWRGASLAEAHGIVAAWRAGDRRSYAAPGAPVTGEAERLADAAKRILFGEDGGAAPEVPAPSPEVAALVDLAKRTLFGEEEAPAVAPVLSPEIQRLADGLFGPAEGAGL